MDCSMLSQLFKGLICAPKYWVIIIISMMSLLATSAQPCIQICHAWSSCISYAHTTS